MSKDRTGLYIMVFIILLQTCSANTDMKRLFNETIDKQTIILTEICKKGG